MTENKKGANTITDQTIELNDGASNDNPTNVSYFPKPNFDDENSNPYSIVDALKSVGYEPSNQFRLKIGQRNNITWEPFTVQYNSVMLNLMKEGKLIIP